jgi:alpha-tubulin suppressor-like RCC1 family protein
VTTDNRAYCWGQGASGQLGDGTSTARLTPVPVAGGHLFRLVESGQFHTCGVSYPDNKAYCWGYNGSDELGDGTSTNRSAPVAVSGGRQFRQVSAGAFHTCGVTTLDKAFCWGYNRYGQLGDGSTVIRSSTPSPVVGTRRFRQVDVGLYHTCGVTTSDRAFCWGYGRNGQMGDGNTTVSSSPKAVAGGFSFERVTTGAYFTCGETTLNRAYCWGSNVAGQLGDGTTLTRLTPVAVAGGRFYNQVSAGASHTCGKTGAAVGYCWGENADGQLGDGTTTDRHRPVAVAGP